MALSFPNASRSYDATYGRVRFLGHDGVIEVAFFLQEDALVRIDPNVRTNERSALSVFDSNRGRVLDVAVRAYNATGRHSYILAAADF